MKKICKNQKENQENQQGQIDHMTWRQDKIEPVKVNGRKEHQKTPFIMKRTQKGFVYVLCRPKNAEPICDRRGKQKKKEKKEAQNVASMPPDPRAAPVK